MATAARPVTKRSRMRPFVLEEPRVDVIARAEIVRARPRVVVDTGVDRELVLGCRGASGQIGHRRDRARGVDLHVVVAVEGPDWDLTQVAVDAFPGEPALTRDGDRGGDLGCPVGGDVLERGETSAAEAGQVDAIG